MNPRTTIEQHKKAVRNLGFIVGPETGLRNIDETITFDVVGFGELIELHYKQSSHTRYFKFHYAFIHYGLRGDKINTWKKTHKLLISISQDSRSQ